MHAQSQTFCTTLIFVLLRGTGLSQTAAVDGQRDASQERSLVRAKEDGRIRNVCVSVTPGKSKLTRRLRDAAERDGGEHLVLSCLAQEGGLETGVAEHGADGVETLRVSFPYMG